MRKMSLVEIGESFRERWFDELIIKSRAFPSYKDGLKEPTRAILTSVARLSKYTKAPVKADIVIGQVPFYKEVGTKNVAKNLFRFAHGNNPLIHITSVSGGELSGLDVLSGNHAAPRYVSIALTDLGEYVLRYKDFFETTPSEVDPTLLKFRNILTPLPLPLLIPQVNLSDGLSNDAPNLNLLQVIDAMILHIEKDKNTTTEELANIITGYEVGPSHVVLTSNQALYDLIERGVMKGASIAPIEFYKNEFMIKGLPYKTFGATITKELQKAKELGLQGSSRGFKSFLVTGILPEDSEESIITVTFKLRRGFRLKDVREEVYALTSLNERLVYENICLDLDTKPDKNGNIKPLTIMSVRDVLDNHYSIGFYLKRKEIEQEIVLLEKNRIEAELMEKLTKPLIADTVSSLAPSKKRDRLIRKYLNKLNSIVYSMLADNANIPDDPEMERFEHYIKKYVLEFAQQIVEEFGEPTPENIKIFVDREVPNNFIEEEFKIIWDRKYSLIYDLNLREKALEVLRDFQASLKALQDKLEDRDEMKKELIIELKTLRAKYMKTNESLTVNMFAIKDQEREERMQYLEELQEQYEVMKKEMPVNVLIDNDFNAMLSFSKHAKMENLRCVFECTTADTLIVLVNNGKSYKVPVNTLKTSPVLIAEDEEVLDILLDCSHSKHKQFYLFATSYGRVSAVDGTVSDFKTQSFSISLEKGEKLIYSTLLPYEFFSEKFALIVKNSGNQYKQKLVSEISIKNKFSNFFALFAGNSTITNANDVMIMDALKTSLTVWDSQPKKILIENGFKRNVSKGAFFGEGNYTFLSEKVPTVNNYLIPSLNELTNMDCFEDLSDVLFPELNTMLVDRVGEFTIEDIKFVPLRRSLARIQFQLPFKPTDDQLAILLQIYS